MILWVSKVEMKVSDADLHYPDQRFSRINWSL